MPGPKQFDVPEWSRLAEWLRSRRRSKNMTQQEVAKAMGVYRSALSTWETGAAHPSAAVFLLWLKALDIDMILQEGNR